MKKLYSKILLLAITGFFIPVSNLLAEDPPSPPKGSGGFDDGTVVGGPIDDYIPLLFFVAIMLGVWLISKHKLQQPSN